MAEDGILIARESAMFDHEGQRVFIVAGRTTAREGHPILRGREHMFRPLTLDFDLPAGKGAAKARTAGTGTAE